MKEKIQFVEAGETEWPRCPYCQQELHEVRYKKRGWLSTMALFWCPHCFSVLGTSSTFNG